MNRRLPLVLGVALGWLSLNMAGAQDQPAAKPAPPKPAAAKPAAAKPSVPGTPAAEKPSAPAPGGEGQVPESPLDRASYGIGLNIGRGMKADGLDINVDYLLQGIKDAMAEVEPRISDAQLREAFAAVQQELKARQAERQRVAADKNKKDGEAFLAANKQKQGVKTLESGLQYQVLKTGTGPSPKESDVVRTHYHGTLISGQVFDSSVERGEPATFPVNGVIKGWTEVLQKMKVGDKWRVFLPSGLAYGETGSGRSIGPNTVLIFEIELLGIE